MSQTQMNEVVIIPEMVESGVEVMEECAQNDKTPHDTVIAVYLAMRAIEQIVWLRTNSAIH